MFNKSHAWVPSQRREYVVNQVDWTAVCVYYKIPSLSATTSSAVILHKLLHPLRNLCLALRFAPHAMPIVHFPSSVCKQPE